MYITSLTPHMHLRGKSMKFTVTYPDGRTETLLDVPKYDFNWQITYRDGTTALHTERHAAENRRPFRQLAQQPREPRSDQDRALGRRQRNGNDGRLDRIRGCAAGAEQYRSRIIEGALKPQLTST